MKKYLLALSFIVCNVLFAQNVRFLDPVLHPFYHGVASGDPLSDRVMIWTRITPDSSFATNVDVNWKICTDTGMTNVVNSGTYTTNSTKDYTVKVDVGGLTPNTFYFYEFTYDCYHSLRGRTKTAPVGTVDSLRFAVVSCSNYEAGLFNVYRAIKERNDIDAVIHLGDYIYEYENGGYAFNSTVNRNWAPSNEIISLSDYRTRYATYHLDDDLRKLHQQFPMFNVWDDHETANDAYKDGADNHTEGAEGAYADRKRFAQRAFFEWLPIRERVVGTDTVINRKIQFGNLVEFIMLDTRIQGRDEQATIGDASGINSTSRTILGNTQESWLHSSLSTSTAQWKVLGQQVMMAPLELFGAPVIMDQWDGYNADRQALLDHVWVNNIQDVAVITGDIHTSWANDVPYTGYVASTGANSTFVEFVTPSVTSPGLPIGIPEALVQTLNPHIKYMELTKKGFIILDINTARINSDWYYVNTLNSTDGSHTYGESYYCNHNERHLRNGFQTTARPSVFYTQAPETPISCTNIGVEEEDFMIKFMNVFPNPASNYLNIQLYLQQIGDVSFSFVDMNGKVVMVQNLNIESNGLNNCVFDIQDLSSGTYLIKASLGNLNSTIKFNKN